MPAAITDLETAAHLSMSLIDLFARARDDGTCPDPMLLRIASSFISDLELLFDTVGTGGTPDMAEIEKLFEEAANVTFTASGTPSCSVIETRLGLPKSFRKVLTPESLKTAMAALEQGLRFYIVRAALNDDEQAAARFLGWVNSGAADRHQQCDGIRRGDHAVRFPARDALGRKSACRSARGARSGRRVAQDRDGAQSRDGRRGACGAEQAALPGLPQARDLMPRDILEGIGEIVTGQAMIYRTLGNIAAEDFMRSVEAEVLKANGDWSKAKGAVRSSLEGLAGQIEKVYQAEAQLGSQLERLQEEAIAVRARPATLLTKPLEAFTEATARQHGRQIAVAGQRRRHGRRPRHARRA